MEKTKKTTYPIHKLLSNRWSPRAFDNKEITEKTLNKMLEAARWATSSGNQQPWQFIVGKNKDYTWQKIFETLVEFNQLWAKTAPVLIMALGYKLSPKYGGNNDWYAYDTGQAMSHLTFQGMAEGVYVHQMAGFSKQKAVELFNIPEDYEPLTVSALGYPGYITQLPEKLQDLEIAEVGRKEMKEIIFKVKHRL